MALTPLQQLLATQALALRGQCDALLHTLEMIQHEPDGGGVPLDGRAEIAGAAGTQTPAPTPPEGSAPVFGRHRRHGESGSP